MSIVDPLERVSRASQQAGISNERARVVRLIHKNAVGESLEIARFAARLCSAITETALKGEG